MSDPDADFERRARDLLQASARGLDAATRSGLTRARRAALDAYVGSRASRRGWMAPVGASLAALLVAMVVVDRHQSGGESGVNGADDLELLADADGLELTDASDYEFYEWAVAQAAEDGNALAGT